MTAAADLTKCVEDLSAPITGNVGDDLCPGVIDGVSDDLSDAFSHLKLSSTHFTTNGR